MEFPTDDPAAAADIRHMRAALALARRGLGIVWPNPSVGCVVVAPDGRVVGRGWTQHGGRPHGETEALRRAGAAARGATAYVSLEPCNHWAKTPPCSEALVEAGVARVVVALQDPDPRVLGSGIDRLRAAGIRVDVGVCAREAQAINAGFFSRIERGRPLVTFKLATSLDGRMATRTGHSRWITNAASRRWAHMLRAHNDAILVGSGTVLADDPALTCRLEGLEDRSPTRVVLDGRLRIPPAAALVRTADTVPTLVVARPDCDPDRAAALEEHGVEVLRLPPDPAGMVDLPALLHDLGERGLTRLLVEGGAHVAASFLRAGLVDRMEWFRAPLVIGGDGLAAVAGLDIATVYQAAGFRLTCRRHLDGDLLESYVRAGSMDAGVQ